MNKALQSDVMTSGVRVRVFPEFLPVESNPKENRYLFSYSVIIANERETAVKLLSRRWIIIDGNGKRDEVTGEGVIGQTPTLAPGEEFEYSSYCPLRTHWGTMEGSYEMEDENGEKFEVQIARFYLTTNS